MRQRGLSADVCARHGGARVAQASAEPVLDARACAALKAYIDKHSPPSKAPEPPQADTKLKITLEELAQVVGPQQQQRLLHAFLKSSGGCTTYGDRDGESSESSWDGKGVKGVDIITIRRVEASCPPLLIGFHTDVACKTMQVPNVCLCVCVRVCVCVCVCALCP